MDRPSTGKGRADRKREDTVRLRSSRRSSSRQQGGGRFVTLVCSSEIYHTVADRWPEAIDVATLARYARAFANGALELAQQQS